MEEKIKEPYDKEFKTFKEQVSILKEEYKLNIDNEKKAANLLKVFPYYNIINGYQEYFMKNKKYINTSIEDLILINLMDKDFLTVIFKYSTYVEDIFKHKLAYIISSQSYEHVDEKIYLNDKNLFKKDYNKNVISELEKVINNPEIEPPTKHYKDIHNHIPSWILFKNAKFYIVTEYFKILKIDLQIDVINMFDLYSKIKFRFKKTPSKDTKMAKQIKIFQKCILTIRKFRNLIGHNLKVFTYNLKKGISTSEFDDPFIDKFINHSNSKYHGDLYTCIISIILLLDNPLKQFFIMDLQSVISKYNSYSSIYFLMYRLPTNFLEILEDLKNEN